MDINEGRIAPSPSPGRLFRSDEHCPEDRDKLLKDYSHGMKNRCRCSSASSPSPISCCWTRPLTSLDVVVAEEMKQLLRELKPGG